MSEPTGKIVYAVFAQVDHGVGHVFLAAYSSASRARQFIDAQDEQLRQCLVVWEIEVDRHPSDSYWAAPHVKAGAFHALAEKPEDALGQPDNE